MRRASSNRAIEPAVATFSDSTSALIGIEITRSHAARTCRLTPRPSDPSTSATGRGISVVKMDWLSGPVSSAATHRPCSRISAIARLMLTTCATGSDSTAPADAFTTAGVTDADRSDGITTPRDVECARRSQQGAQVLRIGEVVQHAESCPAGRASHGVTCSRTDRSWRALPGG